MSEQNKIVQAILDEATQYAEKQDKRNQEIATGIVSKAREEAEEYLKEKRLNSEKEATLLKENKKTLTRLEVNKVKLNSQRELIDAVYVRAVELLEKMTEEDALKLLTRLVKDNYSSGEKIVLSKNYKASEQEIKKIEFIKENNIEVEVSNSLENGFLLVKDGYEKRFTFDVLIDGIKGETEMEIAGKLF